MNIYQREKIITEFFYYNIPAYKQDKEILNLLETASPEKKNAIITLLKIK